MSAQPVLRIKQARAGGVVEIVVWKVPAPVRPSVHGFKYRLAYARAGERIVGYDNERGKGDHRHIGDSESAYVFVDVATLLDDFWRDINEVSK